MKKNSKIKSSNADVKATNNYEEKKTVFNPIASEFKDWCLSTSVHGFSRLINSKNWLFKISWFILISLFAYNSVTSTLQLKQLVFIFHSFQQQVNLIKMFVGAVSSIFKYLDFETQINYENIILPIAEFPAVTFCNLNPFDLKGNNSEPSASAIYINSILSENSLNISLEDSTDYKLSTTKQAIRVIFLKIFLNLS